MHFKKSLITILLEKKIIPIIRIIKASKLDFEAFLLIKLFFIPIISKFS